MHAAVTTAQGSRARAQAWKAAENGHATTLIGNEPESEPGSEPGGEMSFLEWRDIASIKAQRKESCSYAACIDR